MGLKDDYDPMTPVGSPEIAGPVGVVVLAVTGYILYLILELVIIRFS